MPTIKLAFGDDVRIVMLQEGDVEMIRACRDSDVLEWIEALIEMDLDAMDTEVVYTANGPVQAESVATPDLAPLEYVFDLAEKFNEELRSGLDEGLFQEGDPDYNEQQIEAARNSLRERGVL